MVRNTCPDGSEWGGGGRMPTQLSRTGPTMHRHRAAATHRALAFLARAQAHDRRCLLLDHNCVVDYLLGADAFSINDPQASVSKFKELI